MYFRESTRRLAEDAGVAGWVANRPDGSVEAVFEGQAADVEALIEFCRVGPERAAVDSVEVLEEEPADARDFRIT